MSSTFRRAYFLSIDTLDVSELACSFHVKKDLRPKPNTCSIEVRNLSEHSRRLLESKAAPAVRLRAGYTDRLFQLYLGTVRSAHSAVEGPDIVTRLASADSEKGIREGRAKLSVPPTPNASQVINGIAKSMGVDLGNAGQALVQGWDQKVQAMFSGGRAVSGPAADVLTDICRSTGHEWSVQDGKLLLLQRGKALAGRAVLMNSDLGLIGSPTVDGKGIAKARALMVPEIVPGRLVQFDALSLKGFYRIELVEYSGDTHGTDWFADFQARKVDV